MLPRSQSPKSAQFHNYAATLDSFALTSVDPTASEDVAAVPRIRSFDAFAERHPRTISRSLDRPAHVRTSAERRALRVRPCDYTERFADHIGDHCRELADRDFGALAAEVECLTVTLGRPGCRCEQGDGVVDVT